MKKECNTICQALLEYIFLTILEQKERLNMRFINNYISVILVLIFITWSMFSFADGATNFIHLEVKVNGHSTGASDVVEDELGYLWIKSNVGLLRFDGYEFKPWQGAKVFGKHAKSHSVLSLLKHKNGEIWFVSYKGEIARLNAANQFERQIDTKHHFSKDFSLESAAIGDSIIWLGSEQGKLIGRSITSNRSIVFDLHSVDESIKSISETDDGYVYFGTTRGRIFKGNIRDNSLEEVKGPYNSLRRSIRLVVDHNNNLWIGTELDGIYFYDRKEKQFSHFHKKGAGCDCISSNMIISVFKDSKENIWMGTDGGGLLKIDPNTHQLKKYQHSKTNRFSLQSNSVTGIGETKNKDIWVFTNYGSINILSGESNTVAYHCGSRSGAPTRVISVRKAKSGKLWIGTDGEGITLVNEKGKVIQQYIAKTESSHGLPGNYIQAIAEDRKGNMWIGTYLNGLAFYDQQKDRFSKIQIKNENLHEVIDVRSIYIDRKDRVWLGSNIGVFVLNEGGNQLAFFSHQKNGLKGSIAETFMEDSLGQFWIAMFEGGICLLQEAERLNESKFKSYPLSSSNNQTENSIIHASYDGGRYLYLINGYSKLLKFDIQSKKTVPIKGFSNEQLYKMMAVQAIDSVNIWVAKKNGISHLNCYTQEEHTYTWKNGIIKGTFRSGAAYTDQDTLLYFGGIEGLNYFDPSQMKTSAKELHLYINRMEIVNRNAEEIIPDQLTAGVEHLKQVNLNHHQTSFSFQFSVVNDHLDPNYFYAYRLKGFDEDWITNTSNRVATYTNIPYGDYVFEVKAGSKSNVWDIQGKAVNITILPPFWKRWWAYLIYLFFFFMISFFIVRYYIMWVRLKDKLLREELQNEKNKEVYAMKMNFFAKMSHEIQTPLTLILSPIEDMMEKAEGNLLLSQRLQVIKNNANRLSRIAMELMTVRNREMGRLKIRASRNNMVDHLNQIALSFREQARFKKVDFLVKGTDGEALFLWYDQQKIEHIIYNLLTNAFKFTPADGEITLKLEEEEQQIKIHVYDTGIGIPREELKNIFNLFYQSKDGKAIGGSGIGLALSKELIQLHKGEIVVDSEVSKGTCFSISLLKGNAHFRSEELLLDKEESEQKKESLCSGEIKIGEEGEMLHHENKKNLLIVEDNFEMLLFLKDSFKEEYNVQISQNGQEALDCISGRKPDLILSDVMMPVMDGITLCKQLKAKKNTRSIPVILLTTKNATSSKLEGLHYGAIEYINKPFNVKELKLKAHNILEAKKSFIEEYRAELFAESKEMEVESPDEQFIEAVLLEMEKKFMDSDFRLEELADSLHMSYSNIYRKFQLLTDKTLVDFMRSFRLKKAESLLLNYNFTIAEIAFQVGFNDPKYFSKCFKKEYGKTPKQYKKEKQLMGV